MSSTGSLGRDFLDGAHEAFGITIFARLADGRHAELNVEGLQADDIGGGRVLHALIGVMDGRGGHEESAFEGGQGEALVEVAARCQPRIERVKTSMSTAR